jgi:hypothetical protein
MKKILYRIICLVLVFSLCFQPCVQVNARAEKIDLREETSGSAFGYCTAILSGFLASMSVTSSFNVIQLFVRCYLVPTLVKYIVQAMGIKDSKLAAIACVFISTLINSGMDYGMSSAGGGADGAAGAGAEGGATDTAASVDTGTASAAPTVDAGTAGAAPTVDTGTAGAVPTVDASATTPVATFDTSTVDSGTGTAPTVSADGAPAQVAASGADAGASAAPAGQAPSGDTSSGVPTEVASKGGDIAGAAKDATKSIGGYLGSMKEYFSKSLTFGGKTGLTGALIDATKAAAYTAVKLYVTEALAGTNKQLAKSVGYLAGLGVGFAVEQGLEYATGVVVGGYNEKGPTAEKVTDEKALSDKLAAQRELFLTKMLGEAVCQVVVVAGSYAGVNEDLLTLGGALTKRLTMDYMAKSKKEGELAELQQARNDAVNQQNSSESGKPSDGQQQETTNATIAALDKKIAQKEKELEAFSTENVMKKALLYGVSDVALRKISSYAPSPLQGAQVNLALTSLVQAVAIDEENVVQERNENGENVVRPSEDGKDFGFYGRIIGDSVNQANADFMSMGRGKAKIVGRGEDERLDIAWTSGNDMFFAARYSEYVNDVVNHGTTYAMANQLTSSYHNQAVANAYDVISGEVNQRYYRNDSSVKPKLAEKYRQYKESITEKIKVLEEAANGMGDSDPRKAALKQFLEKVGNPAEWDVTTWKDVGLWAANVASAGIGSATLVGLSAAGTVGEGSRDNQLSERVTSGSRAAGTMEKGDAVKDLVVALRDEISAAQEVRGQLMSNQSPLVLSAVKEGTVFKDSNGSVIERPDFVGTFSSSDMAAERMKVLKMQEEKKQQGMLKQDAVSMKEIREKAITDFVNKNQESFSDDVKAKLAEADKIENPQVRTQEKEKVLASAINSDQKEQINNSIKADIKSRASEAADKALAAKGDLQVNAQYQRFIGSDTVYNETWVGGSAPVNTGSTQSRQSLGREVAPPPYSKDMFSQPEDGAGLPQFKQMTVEAGAVKQVGDGWLLIRGGDVTELEGNRGYVAEGGDKDYWVQGTISDIPGGPYLIKDIPTGGVFLAKPEQQVSPVSDGATGGSPAVLAVDKAGPQNTLQPIPGFKPVTKEPIIVSELSDGGSLEGNIPQDPAEARKYFVNREAALKRMELKAQQEAQQTNGEGQAETTIVAPGSFRPIITRPEIRETTIENEPVNTGNVSVLQANHVTAEAGTVERVDSERGLLLLRGEVTPLSDGRVYVSTGGDQLVAVRGSVASTGEHYLISNIQPGDARVTEPQHMSSALSGQPAPAVAEVPATPENVQFKFGQPEVRRISGLDTNPNRNSPSDPVLTKYEITERDIAPEARPVVTDSVSAPQVNQVTVQRGAVKEVDLENGRILISGGEVTPLENGRMYISSGGKQDVWVKGDIVTAGEDHYMIQDIQPGDVRMAEQSRQPSVVSMAPDRIASDAPAPEARNNTNTRSSMGREVVPPARITGIDDYNQPNTIMANPDSFRPVEQPGFTERDLPAEPARSGIDSAIVPQVNNVTVEMGAVQRVEGDWMLIRGEAIKLDNGRMYIKEGGNQEMWVKGDMASTDNHYLIRDIQPGNVRMAEPQQASNSPVQPPVVSSGRVISDAPIVPSVGVNEDNNLFSTALKPLPQPVSTFSNMQLRKIDPMTGYQKPEAIDEEAVEDQSPSRPKYPEVNLPKMYVPEPSQQQDAPQVRGEAGSLRFNQMTVAPGAVTQVGDGWIQVTGDITNLEPGEQGRQSAYVDAGGSQSYYVQGTVRELPDGSVFIKNIKPGGVTLAESPQPDRSLPAVNLPVYNPKIPAPQNDSTPVEGGVISNTVRKQIPTQDVNPGTEERARQNYEMLLKARDEIQQKKGFIPDSGNRSDLGPGVLPMSTELVPATAPQASQGAELYGDVGGWINSPESAPVINQASSMSSGGRDFVVGVDPLPTDMVAAAPGNNNGVVSDAVSPGLVPQGGWKPNKTMQDRMSDVNNYRDNQAPGFGTSPDQPPSTVGEALQQGVDKVYNDNAVKRGSVENYYRNTPPSQVSSDEQKGMKPAIESKNIIDWKFD